MPLIRLFLHPKLHCPMISSRICSLFMAVVLAGLLTACFDHRSNDVAPGSSTLRQRVKSLTQELPNTTTTKVSLFSYDAQNRLASILTYQTPDSTAAPVELSVYQYNAQNGLTQLRHEVVRRAPFQPNPVELYSLSYNALGQVSGLSYANGFSLALNYNEANKLAGSRRNFQTGGLSISGGESFTFTGNNLTGLTASRNIPLRSGVDPVTTTTSAFTHDDKVNPFYGNYIIPAPYPEGFVNMTFSPRLVETYFGGVENILNLSTNNVLTKNATSVSTGVFSGTSAASTSYQYQYNANNLPTVRTTTNNGAVAETLRFAYETY